MFETVGERKSSGDVQSHFMALLFTLEFKPTLISRSTQKKKEKGMNCERNFLHTSISLYKGE